MSSSQKNYEPFLARGDIMGLAEPGNALMPGSMTVAPLSDSVWVRTTHDISHITHGALMQTLSSLSCTHSCIAFVIPPHINHGSPWQACSSNNSWEFHSFIKLVVCSTLCISFVFLFEPLVKDPNPCTPLNADSNIKVAAKNYYSSLTGAFVSLSNLCLASVRELHL